MDFAAVEDVTLDVPGWPERRTLEQTVQALAGGEGFSADDVLTAALGIFMREVGALIQMMLSVMLPVVLASHTLSPQSDSLSAMSRSACFVLVLTPVIVTTLGELSHTRQTIVTMTRHMERLLPMLLTLLTALGGSASSAFLHPMVAAASGAGGHPAAGDVHLRGDGGEPPVRPGAPDPNGAAPARRGLLAARGELYGVPRGDVASRGDEREHRRRGDSCGQIRGG